jgi:hypothetical protein
MDYMTAQEAADKWEITRRRVQILCLEGRILGAIKKANLWLIPNDIEKPIDKRKTRYNNQCLDMGDFRNE